MPEIWLPYSNTEVVIRIPDENLSSIIDAKYTQGAQDPKAEIIRALENPIGSEELNGIVKPGDKIVIVVDDKTRPTPSDQMLPPLLEKLNDAGVKTEDETIIIGSGAHLSTKVEDVPSLIGEDIAKNIRFVIHDCNAKDLIFIGETKRRTKVYVNKIFAEADVRILIGDVSFHYYAGYGGGRKSVLPGICNAEAIQHNHAFLLDPRSRTGNLEGNPVHEDMNEAAHLVKVDFILNAVLNPQNQIVKAFAGDLDQAFLSGVKLVDAMHKVPVDKVADIVVVSPGGYPSDIDLYQSYKAIDSALPVVRKGGVIILLAECSGGHGNNVFYDWMKRFKDVSMAEKEIKRRFVLGGHKAYYLMKALEKAKIILVSVMPDYYSTSVFRLRTAKTANMALTSAFGIVGKKANILVLPHGSTTLPTVKEESK